jgi:hypothetical protein
MVAFAAVTLLAGPARAEESAPAPSFHLFGPPPGPGTAETGSPVRPKPKRRWGLALGELAAFTVIPWAYDRYVQNEEYAHISWKTVADNFRNGLDLSDPDKFTTDQLGHPIHGGLYYNTARTNGFGFWESTAFAAVGAYVWQMFMERDAHSLNDFVTSTMGGPTIGEPMFRLSRMILDNEARGAERVFREIAGALVNPTSAITRLATGEMWKTSENPDDRFPSLFVVTLDGGYRHVGSGGLPDQDQGLFSFTIRYGDPFRHPDDLKPFDAFELSGDLNSPASALLSRVGVRGLVAAWDVGRSAKAEHLIGILFAFDYVNSAPRQFGIQAFEFGLLSRFGLGKGTDLRTQALLVAAPLASLNAGHAVENQDWYHRAFGWGPAAGLDVAARIRREEIDLFTLAYRLDWVHTTSGLARNSTLQAITAEARLPLARHVAVGGGWGRSQRLSTYDLFPTERVTSTTFRAFASWIFR